MTKRLDPDLKVLRACVRALGKSSSERMRQANLEFLWGRFIGAMNCPVCRCGLTMPTSRGP